VIEPSVPERFRILGPLEVWTGRDWTGVSAPKWRALLASLLLRRGEPVPVDELIDGLWGASPPARASNLVSVYVLRLRRLIADHSGVVLVTRSPGYQLVAGDEEVDVGRFGLLAAAGREALAANDPRSASRLLGRALGLWRGRALADVPASPAVTAESARLEELRVEALEARIEADLACGHAAAVVPELRRAVDDHPLREGMWALLMRALRDAGRQAEALEAYAQARELIADELGVDPGVALKQVLTDILSADAASAAITLPGPAAGGGRPAAGTAPHAAPAMPAPGAVPPPVPAQLPADIPDFTGRAGQVAEIEGMLAGDRPEAGPGAVPVVLLMGSGGLGKTTLAVHVAHQVADLYPDGQLYARLLGATQPVSPAEILARFLRDLGMDPARIPVSAEERAGQFRTRLAGKRMLLVLDDARDAAQVQPLLPGSASCGVLITSRGRLPELAGTRVIDLDVLPPPEARALFGRVVGEERVVAEPAATEQVLAACAGLPLAIRIAGARLAARGGWSVQYLADRLADERRRLDELRAGNLAVRASFEVSFTSLPAGGPRADPARAFRMLGLWTGPSITLPAAAALLGEPVADAAEALEILVDGHLLDAPAPDRYRFHDLLRVFAADRARAADSDADRREAITRLLAWYLHTTEAAAAIISPQNTRVPLPPCDARVVPRGFLTLEDALAWCDSERAGLVSAVSLAAANGLHELAWKLSAASISFFIRRSHWVDWIATHQQGLASARVLGDGAAEAWMLNNLGVAYGQQRLAEAVEYFEQALALYHELGDVRGESRAATNVANAYFDLRDYGKALQTAQRAVTAQRQAGKRYGEGIALGVLGCACRELGRFDEAVASLTEALAIFRSLGDRGTEADSLGDLGEAYLGMGKLGAAIECLAESLRIRREIGDGHGQARSLERLALAKRRAGETAVAVGMLSQALALFEAVADHAAADAAATMLARWQADG
jgi:DNA-binding SARP family transcriptional activator